MAVTTNKALLFLTGGVAAAAAVAYSAGAFDPLMKRPAETIAALPEAGQADPKDSRLPFVEPPGAAPQAPAQPAAPEAATPAAPKRQRLKPPPVVPPSFDVVRVEGDGSIVVAGKAVPSSKVDLLVGSNMIGSALAGTDGDFAVVLDDPLKPGDYQIVLRATAPGNVVAMSVETAVVSVPETADGQVLALVEEPGKPSQMITLPEPQAPAAAAKPPETAAPGSRTGAGRRGPCRPRRSRKARCRPRCRRRFNPQRRRRPRHLRHRPGHRSGSTRSRSTAARSSSPARRNPAAPCAAMPMKSCSATQRSRLTAAI